MENIPVFKCDAGTMFGSSPFSQTASACTGAWVPAGRHQHGCLARFARWETRELGPNRRGLSLPVCVCVCIFNLHFDLSMAAQTHHTGVIKMSDFPALPVLHWGTDEKWGLNKNRSFRSQVFGFTLAEEDMESIRRLRLNENKLIRLTYPLWKG